MKQKQLAAPAKDGWQTFLMKNLNNGALKFR